MKLLKGFSVKNIEFGLEKVSERWVSRSLLYKYLEDTELCDDVDRTIYLTPSATRDITKSPAVSLSGETIRTVLDHLGHSETGYVLFRKADQIEVVNPPLKVNMDAMVEGFDPYMLKDIFDDQPYVGVVLVRLGRFGVVLLRGEKIVESKTQGRYVKNRHRAGGSSQRRFERSRERLVRELYDKVCEISTSIFEPFLGKIITVYLGGERHTLNGFKKRCTVFTQQKIPVSSRILSVGDPNNKAINQIHKDVYKSKIQVFKLIRLLKNP